MFGAQYEAWLSKHMASLILVRNVVGELQPKRTLAASRGFLAAARLSCLCLNVNTTVRRQKQVFIHTRLSRAYLALARLSCICYEISPRFLHQTRQLTEAQQCSGIFEETTTHVVWTTQQLHLTEL